MNSRRIHNSAPEVDPMSHKKLKARIRLFMRSNLIIAMLFSLINSGCISPVTCAHAEENSRLRIGFTGSAFQDITNTDIRAAVSVLIQKVAWKHFGKGEARFYETLSEMATDLKNRKIEVLATPVEEFMELRKQAPIVPILVTASDNGTDTDLLLLVRKDSGIRSIRDLRGKPIVMPLRNPQVPQHVYGLARNLAYGGKEQGDRHILFVGKRDPDGSESGHAGLFPAGGRLRRDQTGL